MAIYKYTTDKIQTIDPTTFSSLGITERGDLQRLLRDQIDIVDPDLLVIAEEFCDWDESARRIDLLALDRSANVVVIELKRTEDGGHMELQAIRYAAMVSNLTFDQAEKAFTKYLSDREDGRDARNTILDFLGWTEPLVDDFAKAVRIFLVSAEFSKELTTSVLWLYSLGIDITCIRLKPYGKSENVLLDVQQVIPLPEAEDYQVKVRAKLQAEKNARSAKESEPWNGNDFYVSLGEGEDANWDDCMKYGFITGSGGRWYTRTLDRLFDGARVFVNIPGQGYVGVGRVTEKVTTVDKFVVEHEGSQVCLLDAPLQAPGMNHHIGDPDMCPNLVRVDWIKVVPRDKAHWEKGLFAIQHTACKMRSSSTIKHLCEHFGITEDGQ